jgi:shikimate kinase
LSNIILCGFKGSGKTTFGKKLAQELRYAFIDTDYLISDDCRCFYEKVGEKAFRLAERKAILPLEGIQKTVVATGAGAVLDPESVVLFKKMGCIIYLKEDKEILKKRLLANPYPACFPGKDLEREFEEMYAQRKSIYEDISEFVWEVTPLEHCFKSPRGESLMGKLSALLSTAVPRD